MLVVHLNYTMKDKLFRGCQASGAVRIIDGTVTGENQKSPIVTEHAVNPRPHMVRLSGKQSKHTVIPKVPLLQSVCTDHCSTAWYLQFKTGQIYLAHTFTGFGLLAAHTKAETPWQRGVEEESREERPGIRVPEVTPESLKHTQKCAYVSQTLLKPTKLTMQTDHREVWGLQYEERRGLIFQGDTHISADFG